MRFKEIFLYLFEFRWLILIVVASMLLIYLGYYTIITDASVRVWISKSVIQLNIGDVLIILCVAYFLFRK